MKALVTGATGFVGSNLVEELITFGFDVRVLVRKSSSLKNLEGHKFETVYGDVNDLDSLKQAVRGMDYVFHLAGVIAAPSKKQFFKANVDGTKLLAQATNEVCAGTLKRFVFVSSLAAGGPVKNLNPRTEGQKDAPVSAYGESKLAAEEELLRFKKKFPISIVRPPIVYGPKDQATFVLVKTVARHMMPLLMGRTHDGKKYYSLVHVKDLCRGIIQAAVVSPKKVSSGDTFYLCDDQYVSYEEWFGQIAECLDREPLKIKIPFGVVRVAALGMDLLGRVIPIKLPFNQDKLNELAPDYWICSNQKAKRLLGFAPEYDLSRGMKDAVRWYKKNRWIRD